MPALNHRFDQCLNCNQPLPNYEAFCPACGQKNQDHKKAFGRFIVAFIQDKTQIDAVFWRTFRVFLFKPGMLTREYWAGRRVSYLKPVRLFLYLGVLAFLLLSLALNASPEGQGLIQFTIHEQEIAKADGPISRYLLESMLQAKNNEKAFLKKLLANVPLSLLVILPLFAFVFKLFHRKKSPYLVEHLVFLLHVHAFLFFEISVLALIGLAGFYHFPLLIVAAGISAIYILSAMKRVYGQSWALTILKFGFLSLVYGFSMPVLGLLISMFVSLIS